MALVALADLVVVLVVAAVVLVVQDVVEPLPEAFGKVARGRERAPGRADQGSERALGLLEQECLRDAVANQEQDLARQSSVGTRDMAPPHRPNFPGW